MPPIYVYVRTPLRRNGELIQPSNEAIALPVDEAQSLIAVGAVDPCDLAALPAYPITPESETNDPAGAAPGAAGEASGETASKPNDATDPGAQSAAEGLADDNAGPQPNNPESESDDAAGAAPGAAEELSETPTEPDDATGPGAQPTAEGLVNVNTASAAAISNAAKGIGLATARDLVKHRKANGGFKSLDDLVQVGGIGPATVERNRDVLTV